MELKHDVNNYRGSADFQSHAVIDSRCATYIDIPNVAYICTIPYFTTLEKTFNLV